MAKRLRMVEGIVKSMMGVWSEVEIHNRGNVDWVLGIIYLYAYDVGIEFVIAGSW